MQTDIDVYDSLRGVVTEALDAFRDLPPFYRPLVRTFLPYEWTMAEFEIARNESRRLFLNNEFALGGAETRANYIVDQGFIHKVESKSQDEPVGEAVLKDINEYVTAVIEANDLGQMQRESMMRYDRDGNVIIRTFDTGEIPEFRFVEDERMRTPPSYDGDRSQRHGVITDPKDSGRVLGYWIEPGPGEAAERVPEEEIVHIKANVDSSSRRGIPTYYPVFENLRRCEDLLTSMTTMAKSRAKIALIMQIQGYTKAKEGETLAKLTQSRQTATDGTMRQVTVEEFPYSSVLRTDANTNITFPQSVGASDFVGVLQADLRAICTRLSMPEWMFTGLADQKYSNAFVVEAPTLKAFRRLQGLMVSAFGDGRLGQRASLLWRALRLAVRNGLFPKEVLNKVKIRTEPPSLEVRDKNAEAQTNQIYLQNKIYSRKFVQQSLGVDPERMEKEIEEEKSDADGGDNANDGMKTDAEKAAEFLNGTGPEGETTESAKPGDGQAELKVAMIQLAAEGDWESVNNLAELGDDPDTLAEFVHGTLESYVFEAGKTGVFTDSKKRRYRLQDGKRVPLGDTERPENAEARKHVQNPHEIKDYKAFAETLQKLSKAELQKLAKDIGENHRGLKAELVERMVQWAKGKAPVPPVPETLIDYMSKDPSNPVAQAIAADTESAGVVLKFQSLIAENKDLASKADALNAEHAAAEKAATAAATKAKVAYDAGKSDADDLKTKAADLKAKANVLAYVRDRAKLARSDWSESCRQSLIESMGKMRKPSLNRQDMWQNEGTALVHPPMSKDQEAAISKAENFVQSMCNDGYDPSRQAAVDAKAKQLADIAVKAGGDPAAVAKAFRDLQDPAAAMGSRASSDARKLLKPLIGDGPRIDFELELKQARYALKLDYRIAKASTDRAFCRVDIIATDDMLDKGRFDGPHGATSVHVHEFGHYIENFKPGVHEKIAEFVKYRTAGETPTPLNKTGTHTDTEPACLDNFDRAFTRHEGWYCGKIYGGRTSEILSMGLQKMHDDPAGFAKADPEYFQFLVSVLRS